MRRAIMTSFQNAVRSNGGGGLRKLLVLHMDVNKTLVFRDPAAGYTTEELVSAALSESAWGLVTHPPASSPQWTLWVPEGGEACPSMAMPQPLANQQHAMTFTHFIDHTLKLRGPERKHARASFVHTGQAGAALKGYYDKMLTALSLPSSLGGGYRLLLPSFFHLLHHLVTQDVAFALVLRSFGSDLADVGHELNHYCTATHPEHTPPVALDGTHPSQPIDRRLHLPQAGMVVCRHGQGEEDTEVVYVQQGLQRARGLSAFAKVLREKALTQHTLAVQDDYGYWSGDYSSDTRGKPLLIQADGPCGPFDGVHEVLLDDYIGLNRPAIADARIFNAHTNEWQPMPFEDSKGKHLIKVDSVLAVLDPQYYVSLFDTHIQPHLQPSAVP